MGNNGNNENTLRRTIPNHKYNGKPMRRLIPPGDPPLRPSSSHIGRDSDGLTVKQSRFVDEYLKDLNATQSAIRAGYSARSAHVIGHDLLKLPKIGIAVQKRKNDAATLCEIDRVWVLERYKSLIEYHLDDIYFADGTLRPLDEIPKNVLYAIQGFKNTLTTKKVMGKTGAGFDLKNVSSEVRLPDKKSVLDSLAKYLGMFGDDAANSANPNMNFSGPVQINIGLDTSDMPPMLKARLGIDDK